MVGASPQQRRSAKGGSDIAPLQFGAVAINRLQCTWITKTIGLDGRTSQWPLPYQVWAEETDNEGGFSTKGMKIREVVEQVSAKLHGCHRIGVSCFGPFNSLDPDLSNLKSFGQFSQHQDTLGANGENLVKLMTKATQVLPDVTTDANAAALGELARRASGRLFPFSDRKYRKADKLMTAYGNAIVVCLIFGKGVGGGVAINGQVFQRLHHPEIGHIRVTRYRDEDDVNKQCRFHDDCVTAYAGRDRLNVNDEESRKRFVHYAAHLIATTVYALTPNVVVLAGSVMFEHGKELIGEIRKELGGIFLGRRNKDSDVDGPYIAFEDENRLKNLLSLTDSPSYVFGALAHSMSRWGSKL